MIDPTFITSVLKKFNLINLGKFIPLLSLPFCCTASFAQGYDFLVVDLEEEPVEIRGKQYQCRDGRTWKNTDVRDLMNKTSKNYIGIANISLLKSRGINNLEVSDKYAKILVQRLQKTPMNIFKDRYVVNSKVSNAKLRAYGWETPGLSFIMSNSNQKQIKLEMVDDGYYYDAGMLHVLGSEKSFKWKSSDAWKSRSYKCLDRWEGSFGVRSISAVELFTTDTNIASNARPLEQTLYLLIVDRVFKAPLIQKPQTFQQPNF